MIIVDEYKIQNEISSLRLYIYITQDDSWCWEFIVFKTKSIVLQTWNVIQFYVRIERIKIKIELSTEALYS